MPIAAFIPAIIGAGATVGGAALAAHGQSSAADTQAQAAKDAANTQLEAAREALDFQKQVYNNKQQAVNPYQNMGIGALGALGTGLNIMPGHLPVGTIPIYKPDQPISPTDFATQVGQPQPIGRIALEGRPIYAAGQEPTPQTNSGVQPAQVGERRIINGQTATWDGKGWSV